MALPLDNRQIDDTLTMTTDVYLEDLYDQVYLSNPFFVRLDTKKRIVEGGAELRAGIIYDKVPGGKYVAGQAFDTSIVKNRTQFIFPWTRYYGACNIEGLTEIINRGAYAIADEIEVQIEMARMRIADDIGTDLIQGDGTDATTITGLANYINDGTIGAASSYAGITYGTDAMGTSVKAITNTTGGAFSLSLTNSVMGRATIQPTRPDLLLTTQAIFDKAWDRIQPSQRINGNSDYDDITRAGFNVIVINGADLVADSHVPTGYMYQITTDYVTVGVLSGRNMVFEGWFRPANLDQRIGQVLWAGNMVGRQPRVNAVITGIT